MSSDVGSISLHKITALLAENAELKRGCPCTYGSPCSIRCTCAQPFYSGGCRRCCLYGSEDQRRAAASRLTKLFEGEALRRDVLQKASERAWAYLNNTPLTPETKSAHAVISSLVQDIDALLAGA